MALILQREKRIVFRLAYVGIPFSGKSTIMKSLHRSFSREERGEMRQGFINQDRGLAFDLLRSPISVIPGFSSSIQFSTLPGYCARTNSHRQLLKQVDGILYIVDSQWDRMNENVKAFAAIQEIIIDQKKSLSEIPFVLIFNKQEMKETAPRSYLEETFNQRSQIAPTFEVNPFFGKGVVDSFQSILKQLELSYR